MNFQKGSAHFFATCALLAVSSSVALADVTTTVVKPSGRSVSTTVDPGNGVSRTYTSVSGYRSVTTSVNPDREVTTTVVKPSGRSVSTTVDPDDGVSRTRTSASGYRSVTTTFDD